MTTPPTPTVGSVEAGADLANAIRLVEAAGYRVILQSQFQPAHTRETIEFVLKRRGEGRTDQAIADEMGVSRSTVSGIIWRHKTKKDRASKALSQPVGSE